VYGIEWDTDGEPAENMGLQTEMIVEINLDGFVTEDEVEMLLSDSISISTGWCHNGFYYEKIV
jgi:hypothetical protein